MRRADRHTLRCTPLETCTPLARTNVSLRFDGSSTRAARVAREEHLNIRLATLVDFADESSPAAPGGQRFWAFWAEVVLIF